MNGLDFFIQYGEEIAQAEEGRCFFCGADKQIERHHIFSGPYRQKADRLGLTVPLCHRHHNEPPDGVHFSTVSAHIVKCWGQLRCMQENDWDTARFITEFGRNYLL